MSALHRFLILLGLLLGAFAARAETRVALIVANAAYDEAPLQNPIADAGLVRPALERMGFDVTVVKDADLEAFVLALHSFYADAKGADLALFYFAGHGFAINGPLGAQNYLMSTSADVTSRLDEIIRAGGITLDEIVASISDAAKVSLVFVDACRNDPRISRGGGRGRSLARIADLGAESLFVGLSTRAGDVAEDGDAGDGSPFARAFAAHMPTPGLRLDDAFLKVRQAVMDDTGGAQRPEARDDLDLPLIVLSVPDLDDERLTRPGPLKEATSLLIASGADLDSIAGQLKRYNVIDDPLIFTTAVRFSYKAEDKLKAGEYLFQANTSVKQVLEDLLSGRSVLHSITFPEGLTSQAIVDRLNADETLTGSIASIPREGSLMPDTYKFTRGATRQQMIDQMQRVETRAVQEIWARRAPDLQIQTPEQLVTLASIVEKETGRADERPRVAAVFINRLREGMRLQSDPTVVYGLFGGAGRPPDRPIYQSDLEKQTPYNTYQITGLPPTPIANPGRGALEAVANPSRTNDLYFVADGAGGYAFSTTLEEHNRNVERWRQIQTQQRMQGISALDFRTVDKVLEVAEGASLRRILMEEGADSEAAAAIQSALVANFSFDFRAGQKVRIALAPDPETGSIRPVRVSLYESNDQHIATVALSDEGLYVAGSEVGPSATESDPSSSGAGATASGKQRAIYYYQGLEGQPGQASEGTATWAEISRDGRPAVHATIVLADRKVIVTVAIFKNQDTTLPASHLVEVQFSGRLTEFPIQSIPSLVVKQTEQQRGQPVAGAAVSVTNELFWIALSDDDEEVVRNVQLLREGSWFDIPILFSDQTRALITFEKGIPGDKVFEKVMASWRISPAQPPALAPMTPTPQLFESDYRVLPNGTIVKICRQGVACLR